MWKRAEQVITEKIYETVLNYMAFGRPGQYRIFFRLLLYLNKIFFRFLFNKPENPTKLTDLVKKVQGLFK